ncbi:MAG TPA: hypothetical protein VGB76_07125 [Pyrinomonadaceae bacterium]
MSTRLISSRAGLLKVNRPRSQHARLLELLYLACALLLGALLAATTLSAAPLRRAHTRPHDEHVRQRAATMPRVVHPATRAGVAEFDSK